MIELRNLSKVYPGTEGDYSALKNINLKLNKAEIFGIIGRSGAGKSTLLRCVNLLEHPSQGQVLIDGVDLTALDAQALRQARRDIGMIFQHFNLLSARTVFANVALPLELLGVDKTQIRQRVEELLTIVGLSDRANYYPEQLSGGQKQRVAIARALATKPKILLSDEATSALDPEATAAILDLLKSIQQQMDLSIVLITHELDVIKKICTRAAVIEQGEIIEQQATLNLFANPQHPVAKKLVREALHLSIPKNKEIKWQQRLMKDELTLVVQLTFVGESSDATLISDVAKKFNVSFNIQHADITQIQDRSLGYTVCCLTGSHRDVEAAIAYVRETSVQVEVLTHAD